MDTFFWIISKLFWSFGRPDMFLFLVLATGGVLLWTRYLVLGRWLVCGVLGLILFLGAFPVQQWLLGSLENRFPEPELPDKVDGLIVLGGAESPRLTLSRGQPVIGNAAERLTTFVYLSRRYPRAKLVYSGGSGALMGQEYKASLTARLLFQQLGLDISRVQFESRSRNTWENVVYSKEMIKPAKDEKWILVDSAYRLPRAVGIFRKINWQVIPFPVDYNTFPHPEFRLGLGNFSTVTGLSWILHEWIGIVVYWATGRMSELFPSP